MTSRRPEPPQTSVHNSLEGRLETQGRGDRVWVGSHASSSFQEGLSDTLTDGGVCLCACVCVLVQVNASELTCVCHFQSLCLCFCILFMSLYLSLFYF